MRVLLLLLVALLLSAGAAQAAEVAYVDGGQIWISTLDGSQKRSLSGPSGDEKQWTEVAQADNGTILGVRRQPGKMGTLNATRLWGPDGAIIGEGTLSAEPGWLSYAYPVTLDLRPDGRVVTYGYANWRGFGLNQEFAFGTYVEGSSNWFMQPFDVRAVESGTLAGNRLVGVKGSVVYVQKPVDSAPYSEEFEPWLEAGGARRVDVAATGTIVAVEIDNGSRVVAMLPVGGLGGPLPSDGSDCFLPTAGNATDVSISPDGTSLAWHDDRGVVVAGTPLWFPAAGISTCVLSRAPVVISASGKMPSIGASTAAIPPAPPASPPAAPSANAGTGTGPGTGSSGVRSAPQPVAAPKALAASALRRGIELVVRVAGAGKVTATGRVGGKLVATAATSARRAGKVTLTLRATKAYRNRLATLAGKKLTIKIVAGGRATVLVRTLR